MKKIGLYSIFALFLVGAVSSCQEENEYIFGAKDAEVRFDEAQPIVFDANKNSGSAAVFANTKWSAKSLESWLECKTAQGEYSGKVEFSITSNDGDHRVGRIVITSTIGTTVSDTVEVSQLKNPEFAPANVTLQVTTSSTAELAHDKYSEIVFNVTSNTDWVAYADAAWLNVMTKQGSQSSAGSVVVSVNDELFAREAYVYIKAKNYDKVVGKFLVKQAPRPVRLVFSSPQTKSVLVDASESKVSLSVLGDGKWTLSSDVSWVTLAQSDYEGDQDIVLTTQESTVAERVATITITSKVDAAKTDKLVITQKNLLPGRERDSLALLAIYNSLGGDGWVTKWDFNLPLSDRNYNGLSFDVVDGELRLIDLHLASQQLEGTIPNEIGWLTEMTKIKFQDNKITGVLPPSLNKLTNLTHLYFARNMISGTLIDLSAVTKLTLLDATSNRLTGHIPMLYTRLTKLTSSNFKLQFNLLTGTIPVKYQYSAVINPQRTVPGDKNTDYKLLIGNTEE